MVSFIWKEGASEPLWRKTLISCSVARWIFWFRLFMIFLHQKSCNYFPSYFLKIHRQLTISFFQIYIPTCISTNIKPVSWKFLYNIFLFLSNPWKSCFPFFLVHWVYGIQNKRLDLTINEFLTIWKTLHRYSQNGKSKRPQKV